MKTKLNVLERMSKSYFFEKVAKQLESLVENRCKHLE